jgi:acetoin utilization protein AcuB
MQLREIMQRDVTTIRSLDSISLATQTMLWTGVRHLPVVQQGDLVGVLSERDVLRFRTSGIASPLTRPVAEAMTAPARVAHPEDAITAAIERVYNERVGCLPVMDRGALVGIVTRTDLLAHHARLDPQPRSVTDMTAADIMTGAPITAAAGDALSEALHKMSAANIRHLPVVDGDGRLVGLLTDRDVRLPEVQSSGAGLRVGTVMATDVLTLTTGAPFSLLVSAFVDRRVDAVPVVDEAERLVGIVSYVDALRASVDVPRS